MEVSTPTAWQPITPRGVAAFAHAPWRRLLLIQFIVALLVGLAITAFVREAYFPVITTAIAHLPDTGNITSGRLCWKGETPTVLAEGKFLSLSVDMNHAGMLRSVAHLQVEFGATNLLVNSLLGYAEINYPRGWIVAANHQELTPLWGAWRPHILAFIVAGVIVSLMASWYFLATLYAAPVWLLGFYLNRDLDWRRSWRFCGAALLPGALLMLAAISFYVLGGMDLVQLGFVYAAHIVLSWVYLIVAIFFVPRVSGGQSPKNPFSRDSKAQSR